MPLVPLPLGWVFVAIAVLIFLLGKIKTRPDLRRVESVVIGLSATLGLMIIIVASTSHVAFLASGITAASAGCALFAWPRRASKS